MRGTGKFLVKISVMAATVRLNYSLVKAFNSDATVVEAMDFYRVGRSEQMNHLARPHSEVL